MFYSKPLFKEFFFFLLTLAVINNVATYFDLYWVLKELDSGVHFLGGVTISFFTIWLYFYSGLFAPNKRDLLNFFFISILGVVLGSVLWEIFELVNGIAVSEWDRYSVDTSIDYAMDILGGLAACLYCYMKEDALLGEIPIPAKGEPPDNLPI